MVNQLNIWDFNAVIRAWFTRFPLTPWQTGVASAPRWMNAERSKAMTAFRKFVKNNKGATAIEYGLIAALIAVAAIGAMSSLGKKLNTTFNGVANNLQ